MKYKVCVYAICKNESKHIKRWVESMKEADSIYVLDTGSTDNSVNLLKEMGVNVKIKKYKKFKFDKARNDSLKLVPKDTDICVCTDIDEVFNECWRKELEGIWNKNVTRVKYNLNFSFNSDGTVASSYYISKIHNRNNYKWIYSIHEVLVPINKENIVVSDKIVINHYPDRSKDRKYYLDLLINETKSNPCERNYHYLGREYMYNGMWNEAIEMFLQNIKVGTFKEEISTSMRFMSRCYQSLNNYGEAFKWIKESITLTPYLREPYVEMGYLCNINKDYIESIYYLLKALNIKEKSINYINEDFAWNENIYELIALDYLYLNEIGLSKYYYNIAYKINPNNDKVKYALEVLKDL